MKSTALVAFLLGLVLMYAKSLELSDFTVLDGKGNAYPLANLRHVPAVLIVNVASHCGYTDRHYRELQALRAKHDEDQLAIVAFPCNQFGAQEPGTWEEIASLADRNFGVTFPIMSKIDVNGLHSSPMFAWLKAASGNPHDIPWNFTKFLVLCDSTVKRYSHEVNPMQMGDMITNAKSFCGAGDDETGGGTGEL
ncbi:unnamed protein product [Ectocarpus sp. 4 AP-2014]